MTKTNRFVSFWFSCRFKFENLLIHLCLVLWVYFDLVSRGFVILSTKGPKKTGTPLLLFSRSSQLRIGSPRYKSLVKPSLLKVRSRTEVTFSFRKYGFTTILLIVKSDYPNICKMICFTTKFLLVEFNFRNICKITRSDLIHL